MHEYLEPILHLLNAKHVAEAGYVLMTVIIFVETGLLIGFCLPGDSLLVAAGLLAAQGKLDIIYLNALLIPAAILGDTLGYWIGYHSGPRLFKREKSWLFNPEHLKSAQAFYDVHGGKTIILARFMPIVRTFAPVVAGMGRMDYRKFLFFNVFGGIGWVAGITLAGYSLGRRFPNAMNHLEVIILIVILVSVAPMVLHYLWKRFRKQPAV